MPNYNKTILIGHLTRDPQLRYLSNQTAVADFGLAVNNRYKTKAGEEREEVLFIDVSAFGKQGEVIHQHCQKGKPLLVEGRLKYETWEDKNGGGKRSKIFLVLDGFQFVGAKGDSDDVEATPAKQHPKPAASEQPAMRLAGARPFGDEQVFKEDDIPF